MVFSKNLCHEKDMASHNSEKGFCVSYDDPNRYSLKVWDLPTRVLHWVLVVLVACSFISVEVGGTAMEYHKDCGVIILALLVFRIIWGFVGGRESRFKSFVHGPVAVFRYTSTMLHTNSQRHLGHNPLGGWSVLAMLAVLLLQAGTGLFANDDVLTEGPLYGLVDKATSDRLTEIHQLNSGLLTALVILHICAIGFYYFRKKDNLLLAMFTGFKKWPNNDPPPAQSLWVAVAVGTFAVALVFVLLSTAG
jgi:cytochrome b